jgi:hypothetical protein
LSFFNNGNSWAKDVNLSASGRYVAFEINRKQCFGIAFLLKFLITLVKPENYSAEELCMRASLLIKTVSAVFFYYSF